MRDARTQGLLAQIASTVDAAASGGKVRNAPREYLPWIDPPDLDQARQALAQKLKAQFAKTGMKPT